jgi:hypothetical protein
LLSARGPWPNVPIPKAITAALAVSRRIQLPATERRAPAGITHWIEVNRREVAVVPFVIVTDNGSGTRRSVCNDLFANLL